MLLLDYQNVLIQNVLTERIHGFVAALELLILMPRIDG